MDDNTKAYARPSSNPQALQDLRQVVSFRVGGEQFAFDILRVQEIIHFQELTRVPNSPDSMAGVINLRGRVIAVVSLRRLFGLEKQSPDKQSRIVVVELKGNVLGFIVDAVSEVLRIPVETVKPPPRLGKVEREYVSGVGNLQDRLLILLDLERLMSHSDETWMPAAELKPSVP